MEKQLLKFSLGLLVLGSFFSCGKQGDAPAMQTGFDPFVVVNGTLTSSKDDDFQQGTATIRLTNSAPTVSGIQSFTLNAKLLNEHSAFTLIAFSSNTSLTDGIQFRLERVGVGMHASININNFAGVSVVPTIFGNWYPENVDLVIQVNNYISSSRIFVWPANQKNRVPNTAVFDSGNATSLVGTYPTLGGSGVNQGYRFEDARINRMKVLSE